MRGGGDGERRGGRRGDGAEVEGSPVSPLCGFASKDNAAHLVGYLESEKAMERAGIFAVSHAASDTHTSSLTLTHTRGPALAYWFLFILPLWVTSFILFSQQFSLSSPHRP